MIVQIQELFMDKINKLKLQLDYLNNQLSVIESEKEILMKELIKKDEVIESKIRLLEYKEPIKKFNFNDRNLSCPDATFSIFRSIRNIPNKKQKFSIEYFHLEFTVNKFNVDNSYRTKELFEDNKNLISELAKFTMIDIENSSLVL